MALTHNRDVVVIIVYYILVYKIYQMIPNESELNKSDITFHTHRNPVASVDPQEPFSFSW